MPIFEYDCRSCGTRFEKILPRSEPRGVCPQCGNRDCPIQLSVFASTKGNGGGSPGGCGCTPSSCGCH